MLDDESPDRQDYGVGKGKPPVSHQWKKGQSGNPKGRPPQRKADRVDITEVLNAPIEARINGKQVKITPFEAGFRQMVIKAVDGHLPSIKQVLKICRQYDVIAPPKPLAGGGVVHPPKGVDMDDWLDEVTEWVEE